ASHRSVGLAKAGVIAHEATGHRELSRVASRHCVANRQIGNTLADAVEESVGADHKRDRSPLRPSKRLIYFAFRAGPQEPKCHAEDRRRACAALTTASEFRLAGLITSAISVAEGTSSCMNSSFFCVSSSPRFVTPVRLLPDRLRLATKPLR